MDEWVDAWVDGRMDEWVNRWICGGWTDEWVDEWLDGRLEALVPSRDSRARTRSPSPRAWRPDFPGAAREAP